jgi:uncharacterized protein involved in exopolysaccharide biosynthesis
MLTKSIRLVQRALIFTVAPVTISLLLIGFLSGLFFSALRAGFHDGTL